MKVLAPFYFKVELLFCFRVKTCPYLFEKDYCIILIQNRTLWQLDQQYSTSKIEILIRHMHIPIHPDKTINERNQKTFQLMKVTSKQKHQEIYSPMKLLQYLNSQVLMRPTSHNLFFFIVATNSMWSMHLYQFYHLYRPDASPNILLLCFSKSPKKRQQQQIPYHLSLGARTVTRHYPIHWSSLHEFYFFTNSSLGPCLVTP